MYNFSDVDLILVDTLVNDAYNENHRLSKARGSQHSDMDWNLTISVAFEEFLRSLHQLAPGSAVLAIEAGCPRALPVRRRTGKC